MENALETAKTLATLSHRKALAYLMFTVFMLLSSVAMIVLLSSHLSHPFVSAWVQNNEHSNLVNEAVLGLGLLSASLLSLAIAFQNYLPAHRLEKNGQLADGVITNKWQDTLNGRMLYYVSYRLHEDIEAWENISRRLYLKLEKGCSVPIRYLQQDTSILRLACEQISF
jgi:hypothetical protein